jgi:hypothetical protein
MKINLETVSFNGWQNCYRVFNDEIELIFPTEIGIRIARLGFIGGDNLFASIEEDRGQTGGEDFRLYGGHRFWIAPEDPYFTYEPDNSPITVEPFDTFVRLTQPVDSRTHLQKQIDIYLIPQKNRFTLVHRLFHHGTEPVERALWALSVMAPTGMGILPLPPRGEHPRDLQPASTLTLWTYTDLSDPRWTFGQRFIRLQQDPKRPLPQKIGASVPDGWTAFQLGDTVFLKTFRPHTGTNYPDNNCSVELFTNGYMLELETLSRLYTIQPGQIYEHVEHWQLLRDVPPLTSDEAIERYVESHVD